MLERCLDCRRPRCNRRLIHFQRIAGTDRFRVIPDEEKGEQVMTRGVKAVVNLDAETGRRQIFGLAVKFGLQAADLQRVAEQLAEMAGLVGRWHLEENKVLREMLETRTMGSKPAPLPELAEQASVVAWEQVATEFEQAFPGYVAELVKGQVRVREA